MVEFEEVKGELEDHIWALDWARRTRLPSLEIVNSEDEVSERFCSVWSETFSYQMPMQCWREL